MEFKKVIFRYKRDIRSIPRKELIKNLEAIRENYLKALPEFKKQFRTQAFNERGIGELDIRSKINYYIKKLSKRKLTKKEIPLFQGFLESQARKVTPKSEKQFKILAKQETKYEWNEYLRMAYKIDKQAKNELQYLVVKMNLSEDDLREFLNSNRNVDLSHVVWESEGLIEFETEYGIDLPSARLLDYFGYDYTEYGKSGRLVPR